MDQMADPILRYDYPEDLRRAAEHFLVRVFDETNPGSMFSEQTAVHPTLVAAALHVITGASWQQPSDEQVKASVFQTYGQNVPRRTHYPPE